MKSKIYSSDYMKTTSKGQLWIPVLLSIGYMIAFPVVVLLLLGNWFSSEIISMEQIRQLYEDLWRNELMSTGFAVTSVAAVLNGINHFWYLYSSRKTDFYHSLPVKRSKMFWHRTFMGVLYVLIPYAVMVFFAICIGAMRGCFSLKIMGLALEMLVMHMILYFLVYFAVVLVVCVTGNILMGGLCLAAVFLYSYTLGKLIHYYRTTFYDTFYTNVSSGFEEFLIEYGSPVFLGNSFLTKYAENDFGNLLLIVLGVTGVLGILSCAAYIRRPSESAGRPMIYGWIGVIVKFLVVIPCGLGVGLIFYSLPERSSRMIWWVFGLIFGTVLAHGCVEIVYQMDFRRFLSKRIQLVLAGILVAVCAVCYRTDLTHFDLYLPEREEIAALYVDFSSMNYDEAYYVYKNEDGTYGTNSSWTEQRAAVTGETGVNEDTWEALETIVSSNARRAADGNGGFAEGMFDEEGWRHCLPVKYCLKSGKEIYRNYTVSPSEISALLQGLYEEDAFMEIRYAFLNLEEKYLENIDGIFLDNQSYRLFQNEPEKRLQLLEALRKDMEEVTPEELVGEPCAKLSFQFDLPHKPEYYEKAEADGYVYYSYYGTIPIMPSFKNTIAILKETGYPLSIEDVDIRCVKINYWNSGSYYENDAEYVEYTDEKNLKEIRKALVPSSLWCCWLKYAPNLDLTFQIGPNTMQYDDSGYLLIEKMPEFLKEKESQLDDGEDSSVTEKSE